MRLVGKLLYFSDFHLAANSATIPTPEAAREVSPFTLLPNQY